MLCLVPRAEAVTLNDCLQLSYLPSKRNHMLLLYPREILILDLELSQTVGVVAIERSGVPFTQVRGTRTRKHTHTHTHTHTDTCGRRMHTTTHMHYSYFDVTSRSWLARA